MFEEIEEDNENIKDSKIVTEKPKIDQSELRRIKVPFHRLNPLKKNWE